LEKSKKLAKIVFRHLVPVTIEAIFLWKIPLISCQGN